MCVGVAVAHETHGWKHATEKTGPAIGGRYCPDLTQIWTLDKDGNGEADGCVLLLFIHEKVHIKWVQLKDSKCECPR
jgi:hypothetical protein